MLDCFRVCIALEWHTSEPAYWESKLPQTTVLLRCRTGYQSQIDRTEALLWYKTITRTLNVNVLVNFPVKYQQFYREVRISLLQVGHELQHLRLG